MELICLNNDDYKKRDVDFIAKKIIYDGGLEYLKEVDDDLKNDKSFWLELLRKIRKNKIWVDEYFKYFGKNLVGDKSFIIDFISLIETIEDKSLTIIIPDEKELLLDEKLVNDKDVILLLNNKGCAIIPKQLNNDKDVVLAAVKVDGDAIEYASDELKNDKEVVLEAIKNEHYGFVLKHVSERLKNDKEVVLAAVKHRDQALIYASEELKNDREVVIAAIHSEYRFIHHDERESIFDYVGDDLKNDKALIKLEEERQKKLHDFSSKDNNISLFKIPVVYDPFFKLKRITLRYLFGYLKYDIRMDDQINIIHAPNGYGKSSLIKCIFFFYNYMFDELYSLPFYELSFELEKNRPHEEYNFFTDESVHHNSYIYKYSFINDKDKTFKEDGKSTKYESQIFEKRYIPNTEYETNTNSKKFSFDEFKKVAAGKTLNYIFNYDKERMENIKYHNDLWYKENINHFNRLIKKFFLEDKIMYINNDDSNLEDDKLVNHLVIINNMDVVKEVSGVVKKGEKLNFEMLSSGEKYIIYVLSILLFNNMKDYSLIILDEPELYLHIEWQQVLIDVLREIVDLHKSEETDTNIRMLITTHSPYFMHAPGVKVGNPEYEES